MGAALFMVTVIVPDMDDAIAHYTRDWGFSLAREDRHESGHRWVEIATGDSGLRLRLAEVSDDAHLAVVGRQVGGKVAFFLRSRDIAADMSRIEAGGVIILEAERDEAYGRVVVLADKFGNRWDLIEPKDLGRND
jgi:predicted enzyme related to lactoylglutathione lyase